MAFNVNELNVIRSFIAVTGEAPTQAQLAAAMGASTLTAAIREAGIVDTTTPRTAFTEALYANAGMTADQEGVNYWRGEVSDLGHVRTVAEFQWAAQADAAFVAKVEAATATLQPTGQDFTQDEDGDDGDDGDGPGLDFDFNVEFSTKEATTGHNTLHSDTSDTVFNLGRDVLDAGQSAITNDYTITLKDQLGTPGTIGTGTTATSVATYNAYFLSPIIEATAGQNLGGQLFVRIVDMQAPVGAVDQGLDNVRISAVSFDLNDKRVNLVVDPAKIDNYEAFEAELNAALEAEKANNPDLNNVTIELGDTFTRQRFDADEQPISGELVTGRDIVIKTSSGTLVAGANNATTAGSTGVISQGQSTQDLGAVAGTIQTNLVLDNVGYGSQGGSVNVSGQSASNKGIDIFNVDAKNGVWLTSLTSSPRVSDDQMLKTINLTGTGSFKVGQQQGTNVVASDNAGLVDVQQFNAGNFNGSIQLDASITNAVIARDLNLVDTAGNPATDNVTYTYNTSSGNDQLILSVSQSVIAHEDARLSINTGAGNDYVHLTLDNDDNAPISWQANQNLLKNIVVNAGSGNNTVWTEGSGSATILTGAGSDTIYTDNSGSQEDGTYITTTLGLAVTAGAVTQDELDALEALGVTVTRADTGANVVAGDDLTTAGTTAVYDGAVHARWVVNAFNDDILDLQGNALTNTFLYKGKLTVTFNPTGAAAGVGVTGFESVAVDIPTTRGVMTEANYNQAIKKAINEDAVLSKLLVAKDGPANTLIIESLVDGVMAANAIQFSHTAPLVGDLTAQEVTEATTWFQEFSNDSSVALALPAAPASASPVLATVNTNAITGTASTANGENTVNSGAGNDVIVLSTSSDADTIVFNTGSIGNNTIANYEQGTDTLDFTTWLDVTYSVSGSTGAASQARSTTVFDNTVNFTAPTAAAGGTGASAGANMVSVLDFSVLNVAATNALAFWDAAAATNPSNFETLLSLNSANLATLLNAALNTTALDGTATKNIIMIESGNNDGKYAVIQASTIETHVDAANALANVNLIGTVDLGADLTLAIADFA